MKKFLFAMALTILFSATLAQAQQTPAGTKGAKLIDYGRAIEFNSPNEFWDINAGKYSISLNHNTHFDAHVTLKKSWYTVQTAQEAYDKRKSSLQSYLPGALFLKENESITLPGNINGMSMTYKNPSDLKVLREIMFVYKGQPYELVFEAKEENFQTVKEDFGFILKNMNLLP